MSGSTTPLATGFAPRNHADWLEKVRADLKGGDPSRLTSRTEDGIEVGPLYAEGDLLGIPPRAARPVGRIVRIGAEANGRIAEVVAHHLQRGAGGVLLDLSTPGHSDGLAAEPTDWNDVFEALGDAGGLRLRAHANQVGHARAWLESPAFGERELCSLGLDPYRVAALTGAFDDLEDALAAAARLAAEAIDHPADLRAFDLDADPWSGAGATTAQSVGCLVAALVQTLRALESANVDPARGCDAIGICLRLDPRFFEQIAALRALRLLHARIAIACGIKEPHPLHLTALPSARMLSRRDPWVNLLRQTATGFAALVGGADAVGTLAFDATLERSSELGRRIARNTPIILEEESHLVRVQDPAAGSWFLDHLTREIARVGWDFFQQIEGEGGLVAAMRSGWLLERLEQSHAGRATQIARRKFARTGVSEFANLHEDLPAPVPAARNASAGAWPHHAFDDAFDALRSAADRHAVAHRRPRVFLARLGNPAKFSARETWLANLLAAGGIEAVQGNPEGDLLHDFRASGAGTAILTTDDDTLRERGPESAAALAGVGKVWVAGRPDEALSAAGVARFVHVGIDVVDALGALLDGEGVQR